MTSQGNGCTTCGELAQVEQWLARIDERIRSVSSQVSDVQVAVEAVRVEALPEIATRVAILDARTITCPEVRERVAAITSRSSLGRDVGVLLVALFSAAAAWASVLLGR